MSRPALALRAAAALPAAALAAALLAAGAACGPAAPDGDDEVLVVFAAASLSDALAEAAESFGDGGDGRRSVRFNFAGSNTLAQQVLHGPAPDLFVSADRAQMDRLVAAGRVTAEAVRPLLTNTLVVVVPAGSDAAYRTAADLRRARRVAVADPAAGVPAGVYARRWLEAEGLWTELEPRLVPALDVRAALAAVAGGHVDAGIVYATDAAGTRRVRTVFTAPPETAPPITYVAATLRGGDAAAGAAFLAHLTSPAGRAVLERHGFRVIG